jgi:hypothetical protein
VQLFCWAAGRRQRSGSGRLDLLATRPSADLERAAAEEVGELHERAEVDVVAVHVLAVDKPLNRLGERPGVSG